jgi:NAD(P)H-dependent flavin oxidoreductase YrpB (nitropropane dioxygenase family)
MDRFETPLTTLLGIDVPVIQAPIGSAATPELAAAVSNAGALGMLSLTWKTEAEAGAAIRRTRELTSRPFGVNLVLDWSPDEKLAIAREEGVPVVSFFWGDPSPYVKKVHDAGALVLHSVGSVAEARAAKDAGVDAVVAQGWEAGGHVRGSVTTLVLTPRVASEVTPLAVVAAGGIADGRGLLAALALGASGVWTGTRFLLSEEARVHDVFRERVLAATEEDTVHGTIFDVGWPNAPHRVLRSATVERWENAGRPESGSRPGEGEEVARFPDGTPVLRYSDVPPLPGMTGDVEALAFYAGQSAGLANRVRPAADIVREMVEEAREGLARLNAARGLSQRI